jgi:hypothetical protein
MKRILFSSVLALALVACGPAAGPTACTADAYPDDGYAVNAAAELDLRARFEALAAKMDEASTGKPTAAELEALFAAGTPSLRSITTEPARTAISALFLELELAGGNTWTPADPPVGSGGLYGAHVYDARGVDLGETVEKIVFSGSHFAEAARLMTDDAKVADVDRMVALFGASPAFPMDDKALTNPDVFLAKYAKKRTNPAAATPGPYLAIKAAFINARASIKGGSACAPERKAAFAQIREQWERALLGTAVNYLNAAANTFAKATPTEAEKSGALHQVGESVGFLRGLQTLPAQHRAISDAQLEQVLTTLGGATLEGSEAYRYVTATSATIDRLGLAVSQIQAARQFTPEEIATFKASF